MPINEDRWVSRARLVGLLGEAGAERIIAVFGGTRIFTPAPNSPGFERFTMKIGDEDIAQKFCTEFGDIRVNLPLRSVPLNERIIKLSREMVSAAEIARRLGCTERYVYSVLSRQ